MTHLSRPRCLGFRARLAGLARVAVVGALAILGTPGALAQGPGGGGRFGGGPGGFGGDMLQPSVNSRELDRLTKIAALDKDQQEAVKTLFESYQEQFKARTQDLRTRVERAREEFRDSRDPSVWQSIRPEFEKFRPVREEMEKSFLGDVKTVLREDQLPSWPKFEMSVRRARGLSRGRMSGERVDLFAIVERADLPEAARSQVDPVLEQYESDLDRALAARMQFEQDQMAKGFEAFQNGNMDAMQKMIEEGRKLSIAVRDVNRRYARQVQDLVPEDKKAFIESEVKRQSFGRIYAETRAERLVKAAQGMKDLTDDQRSSVESLAGSFGRDMNSLNDQLAKAQEKMEMTFSAENMAQMWRGGGDGGPLEELYTKRRQLGSKTEDDLRKILTPAQQEQLPKAEEDDRGGRRRGNGPAAGDRPQRAQPRAARDGST